VKLGKKQELFSYHAALLVLKAVEMGYGVRSGDAFRDPRVHGEIGEKVGYGHKNSAHKLKLARDLYLTRHGVYLQNTEDYRELGEWWEKQHPLARWGGRFADGNHFSFWHNGMM
jgi:hypothetical protein